MDVISTQEAAKMLDVDSRTVNQMCTSGVIRGAVKVGNSWAIPRSEIERLKGASK